MELILLAVAGGVLLVAGYKGYLNPANYGSKAANESKPGVVSTAYPAVDLSQVDAHTLGLAFATRVRKDAESFVAGQIAAKAGADIHATFLAPFAPPAVAPSPADPLPPA